MKNLEERAKRFQKSIYATIRERRCYGQGALEQNLIEM